MTILGVGNSFTGGSQSLEIVKDHGYGYTGTVSVINAETTMLEFTSGNYYFVGSLQVFSSESGNDDLRLITYLNNSPIMVQTFSNTFSTSVEGYNETEIIIPSYTEFKSTLEVTGGTSPTECFIMLTGRIYR